MKIVKHAHTYSATILIGLFSLSLAPSISATPIHMEILSNSSWLATNSPGAGLGWTTAGFDDSTWVAASAPGASDSTVGTLNSVHTAQDTIADTSALYTWYNSTAPGGGPNTAYLRYNFNLTFTADSLPLLAQALIAVDDDFDMYVNGARVYRDDNGILNLKPDGTPQPFFVDFTSSLVNGDNVIAIQGNDAYGGFEWMLFDGGINTITSNVPEPGTLALLAFGLAGIGATRRRQIH